MKRITLVAVVLFGVSAAPSLAQPPSSEGRLRPPPGTMSGPAPVSVTELRGQLGASINEMGLQQSFDLSWRHRLSASTHPLLSEAHWAIGGTAAFTPAQIRGGAWIEVAPVSLFVIRAGVEPAYYYGTFDMLTSFASRTDAFDPDARRDLDGANAGTVSRIYAAPTVQFRAGKIVGASTASFERWSSNADGPFVHEPTRDTLLDVNGDSLLAWTSGVLYEHPLEKGGTLSVGAMHALTRVDGHSLNQIHRVGVVAIRQFEGRWLGLARPNVALNVSRYLDDPSKKDEWAAAMAIGFSLKRK